MLVRLYPFLKFLIEDLQARVSPDAIGVVLIDAGSEVHDYLVELFGFELTDAAQHLQVIFGHADNGCLWPWLDQGYGSAPRLTLR
ncbi:hypothetical protein D3Y57_00365 (plasmid) [Sphingomonas paeninsulae]|uniref:Uncharacterized protein n=1 Tax=Sphingomonas paeninsulae TaxID=2319844 RepID=A0A494T6U9_SPHPE|nr:hypothetical protein D3Y57_00365 [Sphingomonas paeninsulae]